MATTTVTREDLKRRTMAFAVRIIRLFRSLPKGKDANVIGVQLLRCGTAVGANYHMACRGRSRADFISKLGIVVEEADESVFWIQLLIEAEIMPEKRLRALHQEANELTAIFTAARTTARKNDEAKSEI
jgi:four helix bundle protein